MSHGYDHIVAIAGAGRNQLLQLFSQENRLIRTEGTIRLRLMGGEVTDTQRGNLPGVRFQYAAGGTASWTSVQIGCKPYQRLLRKQNASREIDLQLLEMLAQASDAGIATVFFSRP